MELFNAAWEWAENVRAKAMHLSQLKLYKQCKAYNVKPYLQL